MWTLSLKKFAAMLLFIMIQGVICVDGAMAEAGFPPTGHYMTLQSDHFELHYPVRIGPERAVTIIRSFEHIHRVLTSYIPWQPGSRCHVFLTDAMDSISGWATIVPRNAISIDLSGFDSNETNRLADDLLPFIFIHEYSHILSIDMATGMRAGAGRVFGRPIMAGGDFFSSLIFYFFVIPPHYLSNSWHLEAITVFNETSFTRTGRGRSSYFDMIARMAVHSGQLPKIDQLSYAADRWPYGLVPYFYGFQLARYIEEHVKSADNDTSLLGQMFLNGSNALPFFVSDGAVEVTGRNYSRLFAEALAAMSERQKPRIELLKTSTLTECPQLMPPGMIVGRPVIDQGDPNLVYVSMMPVDDRLRLYRLTLTPPSEGHQIIQSELLPVDQPGLLLSLTADGTWLYYTRLKQYGKTEFFSDLYRYNVRTRTEKRLTHAARIRSATTAPDGKTVVFLRSVLGRQSLWIASVDALEAGLFDDIPTRDVPLHEHDQAILVDSGGPHEHFFDPCFSADGSMLAYVKTVGTEHYTLVCVQLKDMRRTVLIDADHMVMHPDFSPDSNGILYTSDESGVFNVHYVALTSDEEERRPLSNVLAGVFNPRDDGQGNIIGVAYSEHGFYLTRFSIGTRGPEQLPVLESDWPEQLDQRDLVHEPVPADIPIPEPARPYSPARFLFPAWWLPTMSAGEQTQGIGVVTGSQDPMNYWNWLLQVGWGQVAKDSKKDNEQTGDVYGFFICNYNRLRGDVEMVLSRDLVVHSDIFPQGQGRNFDYIEQRTSASLTYSVPFVFDKTGVTVAAFTRYSHWTDGNQNTTGGNDSLISPGKPFMGNFTSFGLRTIVDSTRSYIHSVSREDGWLLSLSGETQFGDLSRTLYHGSVDRYFSLPLSRWKISVLDLHIEGGGGSGDPILQSFWEIGGGSGMVPLRGYKINSSRGENYMLGRMAYRMPIIDIYRGIRTSPLFFRSIGIELFHEGAMAYDSTDELSGSSDQWLQSTGIELQLHTALLEWSPLTISTGCAYAHDRPQNKRVQYYLAFRVGLP